MAIKIYTSGNALRAEDTSSGINILDVPKSRVYYFNAKLNQSTPIVKIGYLPLNNNDQPVLEINLSDAVDVNSVAFTADTFREFCNANLGFDQDASIPSSLDPAFGESTTLEILSQPIDGFSGASDFNTDGLEFPNSKFILYLDSDHTSGTPTATIEFSGDNSTWYTYKSQSNVPIPETFFDDEFYPKYIRVAYTANSSNGNVTFKVVEL